MSRPNRPPPRRPSVSPLGRCFDLLLALLLLLPATARAGTWQFSVAGSGGADAAFVQNGLPVHSNWTPPPPSNNGLSFGQFGISEGYATDCTFSINATIRATWMPDTSLPSDPAPPSLWLTEYSEAEFSSDASPGQTPLGSASDGLGDAWTYQGVSTTNGNSISTKTSSTLPPPYWTKYSVSNGKVTYSRSFSGGAHVLKPGTWGADLGCKLDSYSVYIHAQPYNFIRVPGKSVKGNDGTIDWTYAYSSTDGNTANLTTCYWHEYLTYPGTVGTITQPTQYDPPKPPFNYTAPTSYFSNPSVNPGIGNKGGVLAQPQGQGNIYDITKVPAFVAPSLYAYGTFSVTQVFQFDDTATGEANVQIPGPDSGPFTIVRTVQSYDANNYQYSVTKAGVTNTLLLPTH